MSDENCCGACGYPIHATKESACDWCRQSADRIEALTVEREFFEEEWVSAVDKLNKAVEALAFYTCAENGCGNCPEQDRGRVSCGWTARATLAEIEGEKE